MSGGRIGLSGQVARVTGEQEKSDGLTVVRQPPGYNLDRRKPLMADLAPYGTVRPLVALVLLASLAAAGRAAEPIAVDLSEHKPASGVTAQQDGARLRLTWPMTAREFGVLVLHREPTQPLIEELGIAGTAAGPITPLLRRVHPVTVLTVGSRELKQGWNVFFDNPPRRPHQTHLATLRPRAMRVHSHGRSSTVVLDGLTAGPFRGEYRLTVYPGCRLVHAEAVVRTDQDATAFLYDTGLTAPEPFCTSVAWLDTADRLRRMPAARTDAGPVAVRHRAVVAETEAGSVAVFPPPHQYLYPLDFADNFRLVWHGRGYRNEVAGWGLGTRQPPEGDGRFVPWVNAPPGTRQHLGVFYLLSGGRAEQALEEVRRFTHGDRFPPLEGYRTFTSHYHIEHTRAFLEQQRKQSTAGVPRGLEEPPFVKAFKAHGVDIVHLAEFHYRHTPEVNAQRLHLLRTLHDECRRLSDGCLLVLPGEEPNVHLGGHWISLFPRPVYWELHPQPGTPLERTVEGIGTVYAVHGPEDVLRLMERENGLMWTAHPRIKSSYGFPDRYRDRDFYRSPRFLGAAWKAMPADASQPRLGVRALDLLDDMANWGPRKYLLGEVDVFQVQPDYELYGHMNVNYVRLGRLPRFEDGWGPLLDALRGGRFFVTTGEVLITDFKVGGKASGEVLKPVGSGPVEVEATLTWTFPPAFAEVIWGDGAQTQRRRIDLRGEGAFAGKTLRVPLALGGAKWVRLEAWDIAVNGAFTQPVWLE
jgi:hypothetical protein